jgi:hypothetical protein
MRLAGTLVAVAVCLTLLPRAARARCDGLAERFP